MLNKVIQKKNLILIIYAIVLLVFWTLTLIFGNAENKVMVLILSLIILFVAYGFSFEKSFVSLICFRCIE